LFALFVPSFFLASRQSSLDMKLLSILGLAALPAAALVKDSIPDVPRGWQFVRNAASSESIVLRVALHQSRGEELEQKVLDVSTPGHPSYGKHLTRDEVRLYTEPTEAANASVTSWIEQHGIAYNVDNDWIKFTTTVGAANALLDTTFAWYENELGGGPKLRTLAYSVPDDVAEYVDMVQPTTRFGQMGTMRSTIFKQTRLGKIDEEDVTIASELNTNVASGELAGNSSVCSGGVTPACLKTLYNVNYTAPSANNSVAFASYLQQYARYTDLTAFQNRYTPAAKGQNFTVVMVNGGLDDQSSEQDSGKSVSFLSAVPFCCHGKILIWSRRGQSRPPVCARHERSGPDH
jgi:tripeptidyl-peptidase I